LVRKKKEKEGKKKREINTLINKRIVCSFPKSFESLGAFYTEK